MRVRRSVRVRSRVPPDVAVVVDLCGLDIMQTHRFEFFNHFQSSLTVELNYIFSTTMDPERTGKMEQRIIDESLIYVDFVCISNIFLKLESHVICFLAKIYR